MEKHSGPREKLRRFDALVGKWNTEGLILPMASEPATAIRGTDEYEWVSGGSFILHRVDVLIGTERVETIEMIGGYDQSSQTFFMRSFDQDGNFSTMHAGIRPDGSFEFTGELMRAKLTIDKDGNHMHAHWENSGDAVTWNPWMELSFTRQPA